MFTTTYRLALRRVLPLASLSLILTATAQADFITFATGGNATTSSIQGTVDSFRTALGGINNGNVSGPLTSGRREINWDGGGATVASLSGPVLSAFTNTRGSTFTTQGSGFLQTPLNDPALASINPSYSTTFGAFSPQRIFTPIGSNITDVTFSVPGSNGATPATVSAFGAVFTDVDLANVTRMEFFNSADVQILSLNVLPGTTSNGSFSFLGAVAESGESIARVQITTGNSDLGPSEADGSRVDVVAMDDFIYSEPVASNPISVPEPTSLVLAGCAALGVAGVCKFRRRSASSAAEDGLRS
jgi:hypothetical protein